MACNKRLAALIAIALVVLVAFAILVTILTLHSDWSSAVKSDSTEEGFIGQEFSSQTHFSVSDGRTVLDLTAKTTGSPVGVGTTGFPERADKTDFPGRDETLDLLVPAAKTVLDLTATTPGLPGRVDTKDVPLMSDTTNLNSSVVNKLEQMKLELNSCKRNTTMLEMKFERVNISCLMDFQRNLSKFNYSSGVEAGTVKTSLSLGLDEQSQLNNCKYNNVLLANRIKKMKRRCREFRWKNRLPEVAEYLNQRPIATKDELEYACFSETISKVKGLHYAGVDIDMKLVGGLKYTCLHRAAQRGYANLTQLLISLGCDLDSRDVFEKTPLFHSLSSVEVTTLLLENGADVNAVSNNQMTPLNQAITDYKRPYQTKIINLLKKYGAKEYLSLN